MGIASTDIYEELEYKFLYQRDLNSIHVLLNLYDLDKNIRNIYPKYISVKNLEEHLSYFFKEKEDKEKICSRLSLLLHEDINRLELYICLKGYKTGFFNKCLANKLEDITIGNISTEEIYNSKYLYHYKIDFEDKAFIKDEFLSQVNKDFNKKDLFNVIEEYYINILQPNILDINKNIRRANENGAKLNFLQNECIVELDRFILNMLLSNMVKLYTESYWYGLNDRVLKRYR